MRKWVLAFLWSALADAESIPYAIMGGGNSQGYGYAAVLSPHSITTPQTILLPSETPSIRTVAINNAGTGLVGCGNGSGNSYIARIPSHSLVPQALNFPTNPVRGVAINDYGVGFAGCGESGDGYAARIPTESVLPQQISLPPGTNGIRRVAINDAGNAIIGGCNQFVVNSGYAAYISPGSTSPQQIGGSTNILYVAINASGAGLIGGGNTNGYAAFVMPNGTALQEITLPFTTPSIYSVALNNSGLGLIGASGGGAGYAALVTFNNPNPQPITIPVNTPIFAVDINNAGAGLIGGGTNTDGYAALVTPNGAVTPLALPETQCPILDVAINNQGVGLIGGEDLTGQQTYVALVAPNGTLTRLVIPSGNGVNFVDINDAFISSVGPYSSAINTQLAFTYALEPRLRLLDTSDLRIKSCFLGESCCCEDCAEAEYSLWATAFGNYVHSKAHREIPCFTNKIAGILAAFDYHASDLLLGGGLGYGSNAICYAPCMGHGHLNEEIACLYGSLKRGCLSIQAALWGGGYQVCNKRHPASLLEATAHFSGGIFAPRIEIALPLALNSCHTCWGEPFLKLNWVNNWQGRFRECGTSGFNLVMKPQHTSLLYSEAGVRFYQHFDSSGGGWSLEEKLSYVNEAPFHVQKATTYFLVPTSPFQITINSGRRRNLCGVELSALFSPRNSSGVYGNLSFQGLFGSSYQSYFVSLTIGKNF
ncbi:TPA: hypothetical protein DDZ86_04275 [Candidatus Dependentiae bacterium]|nr:MAG: hypothetical protein UW09_C0003G0204 [candidate division TM6 bacterium GW2011_GWF2_43_87]HBL98831.1 hypothetical protein [Candidatus Dependentiae bacterium]